MARSAAFVWPLEQHLHPLPRLGEGGRLAAVVRRRLGRARHGIRPGRRHHRQGPSSRTGRKRGTLRQAIGRSKGGLTTKILALTDALGNLVRFVLLPGQRFDTVGVPPLIDGLAFGALIGDTAFDSNDIVADLNERGAKAVIAQHPRRTRPLAIDTEMYKWRHLIENFFCKLKEFKRIGRTVVADHASGEGGEDWREGDRSRYTVFQMAEVVVPRDLFRRILGPCSRTSKPAASTWKTARSLARTGWTGSFWCWL